VYPSDSQADEIIALLAGITAGVIKIVNDRGKTPQPPVDIGSITGVMSQAHELAQKMSQLSGNQPPP
jgi:hypothetical protein